MGVGPILIFADDETRRARESFISTLALPHPLGRHESVNSRGDALLGLSLSLCRD
jgi:hypothetical protein